MPEYRFTLHAFLLDEHRAITHLSNLVRYHGFPATGELYEAEPNGMRKLIIAHTSPDFEDHRRVERAIDALIEARLIPPGAQPDLREIVRTVLDA